MKTFKNYAELQAALALPAEAPGAFRFFPAYGPAAFRCSDCGHAMLDTSEGALTPGYALTRTNEMICYPCADNRQRAEIRDAAGPFYAYLACDGKRVTTWTGGTLGDVSSLGVSRSGWHGSEIARFHVRDIHGQWWQGRGAGRGVACTLRRMKSRSPQA